MTDPFAVLGVAPSASVDEVRSAYRARSMLLHPDLHQGRPESVRREADRAMIQLTEAFEAAMALRTRSGPAAGAGGAKEPMAYRLGRLAARSRIARDASVAGGQDGRFAYRLGWLVGRRRSK
ncbi:MAG: J domain-containing protein [Acidimicrobiales bacterium]